MISKLPVLAFFVTTYSSNTSVLLFCLDTKNGTCPKTEIMVLKKFGKRGVYLKFEVFSDRYLFAF
jgi:hypothetical protein